jgi:biopolymer transport protein ExbB/biopolymer transport protein TolQ
MDLLVLLSIASMGAIVERWLFFRKRGRGGEALGDALVSLLAEGDRAGAERLLRGHPSIDAEVLLGSLRYAKGGAQALASGVEGEMGRRRQELERGMTLLGTLGNNAPFIGLLGTVIGVVVAFADLAQGSNKVQMDRVMGGIAEALIATALGLFVAIPAVIAYNLFERKISAIEDNVSSVGMRMSAILASTGPLGDGALGASARAASADGTSVGAGE